jgi:hypothetical protein
MTTSKPHRPPKRLSRRFCTASLSFGHFPQRVVTDYAPDGSIIASFPLHPLQVQIDDQTQQYEISEIERRKEAFMQLAPTPVEDRNSRAADHQASK